MLFHHFQKWMADAFTLSMMSFRMDS